MLAGHEQWARGMVRQCRCAGARGKPRDMCCLQGQAGHVYHPNGMQPVWKVPFHKFNHAPLAFAASQFLVKVAPPQGLCHELHGAQSLWVGAAEDEALWKHCQRTSKVRA